MGGAEDLHADDGESFFVGRGQCLVQESAKNPLNGVDRHHDRVDRPAPDGQGQDRRVVVPCHANEADLALVPGLDKGLQGPPGPSMA